MPTDTGKGLQNVDAATLKTWMESGSAVLVDVREPAEFAGEHISGAHLVPLSAFDPTRVPPAEGKKLVLHCRSGQRSARSFSLAPSWGHLFRHGFCC